jgi:ADP-ribose pyrophosphatase YjhB (NUDIX family)
MFPVSIKGVVLSPRNEALLLLNERDEWELPGRRIELGESSAECLTKGILETLELEVRVGSPVNTFLFEATPGRHVFIATYRCAVVGPFEPVLGAGRKRIGLFPPNALPPNLPRGYRASIATVTAERATL